MDREFERAAYPRVDAIPFESEHRFMATLQEGADGKQFLLVKGAPEVILDHCDQALTSDGRQTPIDRGHFDTASDKLASRGERVLALGWLEDPGVKAGNLAPADLPKSIAICIRRIPLSLLFFCFTFCLIDS